VFFGLVAAAWTDGFQRVGWLVLAVLAFLTAVSLLLDLLISAGGARKMGAGRAAVLGALLGTVIGLFFGLPGLLLGPFAGAFAGEYLVTKDLSQAGKAGFGTWIGFLGGIVVKLAMSIFMVGIFVTAYFF
jgi:uncharacterized protein